MLGSDPISSGPFQREELPAPAGLSLVWSTHFGERASDSNFLHDNGNVQAFVAINEFSNTVAIACRVGNDGTSLDGGSGNDVLTSGSGVDWLVVGLDNDTLNDGDGIDALFGGDGNDIVNGSDVLDGGAGIDVLRGMRDGHLLFRAAQ